jgi:hypothetical protein
VGVSGAVYALGLHEVACAQFCDAQKRARDGVLPAHDDEMSFICSCRNKNQPKDIYPKGISHHTRLFRGPSTNDIAYNIPDVDLLEAIYSRTTACMDP